MTRIFAYSYAMNGQPKDAARIVPDHVAYWASLNLDECRGGPYADRSGGLILFTARDMDEAQALADADPFVLRGAAANRLLKEWLPASH